MTIDKIHEFGQTISKNECMKSAFNNYDCLNASQEQATKVYIVFIFRLQLRWQTVC